MAIVWALFLMSHTKTDLFLFDIDGTLIASGGAGEHALNLAIAEYFHADTGLTGIEIAGRTDRFITRSVFERHEIEPTPERVEAFLGLYLKNLAVELPRREGRQLPGIAPLIAALQRCPQVALALLTGNLEAGARLKLTHYHLWDAFDLGAYADDSEDRNQLGPVALERARTRYGVNFAPERVVILGDTPHDIACGRAIGARTVAVATGPYTTEALATFEPDFLYADLSQTDRVLADLLG